MGICYITRTKAQNTKHSSSRECKKKQQKKKLESPNHNKCFSADNLLLALSKYDSFHKVSILQSKYQTFYNYLASFSSHFFPFLQTSHSRFFYFYKIFALWKTSQADKHHLRPKKHTTHPLHQNKHWEFPPQPCPSFQEDKISQFKNISLVLLPPHEYSQVRVISTLTFFPSTCLLPQRQSLIALHKPSIVFVPVLGCLKFNL